MRIFETDDMDAYDFSTAQYGDVVRDTTGNRLKSVMTDRGRKEFGCILETWVPSHIVDPIEFFKPILDARVTCIQLWLCPVVNAAAFATLFDHAPDPRLIHAIEITCDESTTQLCVYPLAKTSLTDYYIVMNPGRDVMTTVNQWARDRAKTRVIGQLNITFSARPPRAPATYVSLIESCIYDQLVHYPQSKKETEKIRRVDGDDYRTTFEPVDTDLSGRQWRCSFVTLRENATTLGFNRKIPQLIASLPADAVTLVFFPPLQCPYRLAPLELVSWFHAHGLALGIALAMEPLCLPAYVLLWILQKTELMSIQNERRLVDLLQSVARSTRRARALRTSKPDI